MVGSSAVTSTDPVYSGIGGSKRGSAATFTPTCFMATITRDPPTMRLDLLQAFFIGGPFGIDFFVRN